MYSCFQRSIDGENGSKAVEMMGERIYEISISSFVFRLFDGDLRRVLFGLFADRKLGRRDEAG